jgi:hypothetical protein
LEPLSLRISVVTFFYRNNNKNEKDKKNIFIRRTRASSMNAQIPFSNGNNDILLQESGLYVKVVFEVAVVVLVVVSVVVVETVVTSSVLVDEYVVESV